MYGIKKEATLEQRIMMLGGLQDSLLNDTQYWEPFIQKAYAQNTWFTPENSRQALSAIAQYLLDVSSLRQWVANYKLPEYPVKVGLIMAGNIPLVGFADWLAVFICGHTALVKLSSKDEALFPAVLRFLEISYPDYDLKTVIVNRLTGHEAVIATGSNNSAQYFQQYFEKVPHIIRRNRASVAVLHGNESDEVLKSLWHDISDYFGMGCRNVSLLFVPGDYQIEHLLKLWDSLPGNQDHSKYKNNLDYNLAVHLLNQSHFLHSEKILLVENKQLFSRIASVHFQRYTNISEVNQYILNHADEIQCIVSGVPLAGVECIPPGRAQSPELTDYADSVDTMAFLVSLNDE